VRARAALRHCVIEAFAAAAPRVRGDVTVVLTGDRAMRRLNRRFRGVDRATDVLSFSFDDGGRAGDPFGDIVISVDTASRQARAYRAPLTVELRRLAVHGALHLCGFDHERPRDAAKMFSLARRILARIERSAPRGVKRSGERRAR
jgi:probable rRNA maturation factor